MNTQTIIPKPSAAPSLPAKDGIRFKWKRVSLAVALLAFIGLASSAVAQVTKVVFEDDFSSNNVDPAKYIPSAPFFEGGVGDIHAEAGDGVMRFVGTTTQQWWSGGTLQIAQTFNATEDTPVTLSIDRVSEAGQGTASRSALWILDESQQNYILFADVRGEQGWRYNRKIGQDGDVPTGGGTILTAFDGNDANGVSYDNGGLRTMQMVANGKTVKLLLDGKEGAEVAFPFNKVVFHFGSYARANNDTANTTWDNLRVETVVGTSVVFADDFSAGVIDPAKFKPGAPFFEGGVGNIHAEPGDGVMRFVGTTTQQWWSGGTLQVVPTFNATEETPVTLSIDRVSEAGQGTASRSALWILDESQQNYILFADVRGEQGWRYNRKIGEDGDVPTGGGTILTAFDGNDANGVSYDNGGLRTMQMVANGKTVKLLLDGKEGAEVSFPFNKVVFHFGSYARANNDTANTTWDNLVIETVVQPTNVLFEDDFSSTEIDPARYQPASPFFEGGVGDIHAEPSDGTMRFVGTTTQQWWSGGTLRVVPTFEPSDSETITLTIDRVSEAGQGTASRSALWIMDETEQNYILFADVRGEQGWRYNRKIGKDGDVPTGGGTILTAFDGNDINGRSFDDGGLRTMGMVANGSTVKLLLDGIVGAEVEFPFSPVVFHFGSYARANNDTADTTWDNLRIESEGGAAFRPNSMGVLVDRISQPVTVRLPQGLNSQNPVELRVVSSNPNVAVPEGGSGGAITLTFEAGGSNTQTFRVRGVGLGVTQFTIQGNVSASNRLSVAVLSDPGVVLEESFASGNIDPAKWEVNNQGYGTGTGSYTVSQTGGQLSISGVAEVDNWSGASLRTKNSYIATKDLNLSFEIDRVSVLQSVGVRTGVFITNEDRSQFIFFSQNSGDDINNLSYWQVNESNVGNGVTITEFLPMNDLGNHRMKLVADSETVEVFLDGVSGGKFPFNVSTGIYFEVGAYAEFPFLDAVDAIFDNVVIENVLPCIRIEPSNVTMTIADRNELVVSVPSLLTDSSAVSVTVKSTNPNVAIPSGATNGELVLNFAQGGPSTKTVRVHPVGFGATTFKLSSSADNCTTTTKIEVTAYPKNLLVDNFSSGTIDPNVWVMDNTPFIDGTTTADSSISIINGQLVIDVEVNDGLWAGMALYTANSWSASINEPLTFELDRVFLDKVLTTGTGSEQRTGIWVRDGNGNFIFFHEHKAWDGRSFGWGYNISKGDPDDNVDGNATNIPAFDGGTFDDGKNHRLKIVVNGSTAKLFLDNVFGAELDFPFSEGLSFGIGAYADEFNDLGGNVTIGTFDNAVIKGEMTDPPVIPSDPAELSIVLENGNAVISWTQGGTLQSTASLAAPVQWSNVSPAPSGTSLTVPANQQARYYRVVQ